MLYLLAATGKGHNRHWRVRFERGRRYRVRLGLHLHLQKIPGTTDIIYALLKLRKALVENGVGDCVRQVVRLFWRAPAAFAVVFAVRAESNSARYFLFQKLHLKAFFEAGHS